MFKSDREIKYKKRDSSHYDVLHVKTPCVVHFLSGMTQKHSVLNPHDHFIHFISTVN